MESVVVWAMGFKGCLEDNLTRTHLVLLYFAVVLKGDVSVHVCEETLCKLDSTCVQVADIRQVDARCSPHG